MHMTIPTSYPIPQELSSKKEHLLSNKPSPLKTNCASSTQPSNDDKEHSKDKENKDNPLKTDLIINLESDTLDI